MLRAAHTLSACAAAVALSACSPSGQVSDSGFGAYEVSLATWRDGFAAAWYDTRNGNAEIYARALDGDGRNAGPELRLTTTPAQSYEADIAPLADAFAIAWYEKSADEALRAQIGVWARDGTPQWSTPLAVGMGIYLPMQLTLLIPVGAFIGRAYERWAAGRRDPEFAKRMGVLAATGLIVGESLFGVLFAGIVYFSENDAPLAVVGEEFETIAHFAGPIGFAAIIWWLYARTRKSVAAVS